MNAIPNILNVIFKIDKLSISHQHFINYFIDQSQIDLFLINAKIIRINFMKYDLLKNFFLLPIFFLSMTANSSMISKAEAEAGIASSENELLGHYVALSEWCPDNYLMERLDANVLFKYADKEIKKRISVNSSTAEEVNKAVNEAEMLFSMISNNYALKSEAETLCLIASLMGKSLQGKKDRY